MCAAFCRRPAASSAASWAGVLFLAGLLLGFRSVAARRMRYFLLMCLGMFIVVQALGQTQLSVESPEVNSENLLVLLAPLVFIYGVSFFPDAVEANEICRCIQLRYAVVALFVGLSCLPMIFALCCRRKPARWPIRRIIRRTSRKPPAG